MMKLFNFSLRRECNYSEHKGGKCYFVNLCVCKTICVCVYFYLKKKNLKQCVKKNQPKKKLCIKQ